MFTSRHPCIFLPRLLMLEEQVIVCFSHCGNHSNRLIQNLHFEAFCYDNNIQFLNPTFSSMRRLYNDPVQTRFSHILDVVRTPIRLLQKAGLAQYVITFNEDDHTEPSVLSGLKGISLVDGWGFRVYEATKKHYHVFRRKYSLRNHYLRNNRLLNLILDFKKRGTVVVGIHVRRGDYAIFQNGDYFYSDDLYNRIIANARVAIGSHLHQEIVFVIFSNERTDFKHYITSRNKWYIDHHLMSQCDYLIGPPSTFTMWASYMGRVPYLHVSRDANVDIGQFRICYG